VELFEQIRREYEFGIGTIVGVAKKLGVHRRMVREAIRKNGLAELGEIFDVSHYCVDFCVTLRRGRTSKTMVNRWRTMISAD
jgi:hypothetical protein